MQRLILHSDMNSFYASVEMMLDPALRGKAVAVCGSTEDRHGIVLAKSESAKKAGVKTGMVNWEARRLCPELILVSPQFEQYLKYSLLARDIYSRYTDKVEPYGMDECFLDCTGTYGFKTPTELAEDIRKAIKSELGLTVSIGVSFNKVFAKLGSDMKKPDAITEITCDNFKEKVWPLPASDLLYVGRSTTKKLATYGIKTIGQLAMAEPEFLKRIFGVNGLVLWQFANGRECSPVADLDYCVPVKSIGHGITCTSDLENEEEVWRVMLELSQDIGHKLRCHGLAATGVQITLKDKSLNYKQYQSPLSIASQSPMDLAQKARELFSRNYTWSIPVRAVTVRAISLVPQETPQQFTLFLDPPKLQRQEKLDGAVESIRSRFGKRAIYPACLQGDLKMPESRDHEVILPGMV